MTFMQIRINIPKPTEAIQLITYLTIMINPSLKLSGSMPVPMKLKRLFKSLKTTNTAGFDETSNHLLKLSSPYIISPLMHICNAAVNSGVFPDRLKYAIVKPIHKKAIERMFQTIDQYLS